MDPTIRSIDVPFSVPFTHRVRFTRDVLGADRGAWIELLVPEGSGAARVQFWVDEGLAAARPDLKQRLHSMIREPNSRIEIAGNIQIVPGGEAIKNDIHILERMLKVFHEAGLDRRSYVVVLGGGSVLDTVGFATAIAHRGIRLVRVPTTTLSQADSGLGVKNGVNLFGKKNWVGSFAVPWGVVIDETLLETLDVRHYRSGFSEAVKVALIKDRVFFEEIERDAARIRARDSGVASRIIRRAAELHLDHITRGGDPFEALRSRPLDYGHWSAHKLEALSGFTLPHGESVSIGVGIDTVYSALKHGLPWEEAERVLKCLWDLGLPLDHPCLDRLDELLGGLEEFRQHLGGMLTVTMIGRIGSPLDVHEVDRDSMVQAVRCVRRFSADGSRRKGEAAGLVFTARPA